MNLPLEWMPGSNSGSAAFFRGDSLDPPPFHASSTFAEPWNWLRNRTSAIPVFQQSDDWLRCYRDMRLRDDMPRELNPLNI